MRKKFTVFFVFLLMPLFIMAQQAHEICGYWRTLKGNAQIEIFRGKDGKYAGKVVWLKIEKDRPDINNENESLRKRKILGLHILNNLTFDSKQKRWGKGKIYDPETGKIYNCNVKLEYAKEILAIKGFIPGLKILSRETHWVRENKLR